jgi:hypothetical protein
MLPYPNGNRKFFFKNKIMKDLRNFIKTTIQEFLNEQIKNSIKWIKPEFETEEDEFTGHFFDWMENDVLQTDFETYSYKDFDNFWNKIVDEYNNANVELLNDDEWSKMENTDSWTIHTEDDLFDTINIYGRDKERIINYAIKPIKEGGIVETPIVAYINGHPPYLVAGNTRLSVCRMLGVIPMVTKIFIK